MLLWMGGTLHTGGADTTDPAQNDWRTGLFASCSLGWLRTEVNHMLDIPREEVEREHVRRLRIRGPADPQ